uniref:Crystaline entomocidal protoxin n=1 Tax=Bacillus thuringiensis TaxID=1428 RepID=U5KRR9_BACTU|nr:pesticidal protein [Bacillus thuringiensis]
MNQNKHGIIGASNCGCTSDNVAKYPLANNPYSSALNLNSCQNSSILNWINIIGDAAKEAVSIGTTIVSLITAPSLTGLISIVYDLIGKVLGGSSGQSISDLSICDLLSIIDLRVNQSVLNDGIADFNGSVLLYRNYLEALDSWNKNPNSASAEELRTRFRIADSEFDRILTRGSLTNGGSLARQNAQILLLPSFASAAFFHLLLLRDATRYGTNWGLYNATPFINYQSKLVELIELYTDYCVHWYNRGFNELRQRGTSATAWLEFHRYRREMTLMVLDIVASFSSLDITNYPIETDFQLSRVIYTDPIGFVHRSSLRGESWFSFVNRANFSDLENAIPNPRPSWFLNNMIISTGSLTLPVSPNTDRARVWYGSRDRISPANSQVISELISGQHTNSTQTILGRNIFRIDSQACNLNDTTYGVNRAVFYHDASEGSQRSVYEGFIRTTGIDNPRVQNINTYFPGENSNIPTPEDYTHLLSTTVNLTGGLRQVANNRRSSIVIYGWTHKSLTRNNTINPGIITQIPMVKLSNLPSGTNVVRGPGFTGGDILRRTNAGNFGDVRVNIAGSLSQRYRVRIRYASTTNLQFHTSINGRAINQANFPATMNIGASLNYRTFRTVGFTTPFTFSEASSIFTLSTHSFSSGNAVYIDRIEFVPAEVTFEAESDLERAQKAVNALFTSSNQIGLKTDVTDYHIDQVSNLVACLSDEFCLDEKRELSEKVKHAKRLSDERNLLQDPNFRGINRQLDRGWRGSTDITIQGGDDVFKENYVTLPGTFDECYPTYLYQKIDESKLKAYTRYELRGYIEDSQDLEVYLIRYNAKHETLNVPGTGSLWPLAAESSIGRCGEPNRCAPHIEWNPDLDCSCRDGEKCAHHSHHFSLDIDVGCTDLNEDLGVWVIFKIKTQDGHARLGNLEFLEEKPLLGEALARVKRAEKKWRDKRDKLELETNIVYKEAKESVDALFVDSQYNRLQTDTNIAMIHAADKRVHRIREAYLPELSVIPGVNAAIFEELEGLIFTAFSLYDARNVIKNGDFNHGLSCWNVKGHVDVEEQNNHRSVLVVPEWEAEVSQEVRVCPGRGYILRVTAYKEGYGEGCVTIHEIEDHTDELKFRNCEEEEGYPNNTVTCNDYTANQDEYKGAYPSRNGGYEDTYDTSASVHYNTPTYEEEIGTDLQRYNQCENNRGYGNYTPLPAGYVTKELEYFPETDKVWIEIGETEGTFIVDSVELLLMEE